MQAVILAGGLGTRLWPLTMQMPKPLLPVQGRPLLAHLLERLPRSAKEVFLAVSFLPEKVEDWVNLSGDPALDGLTVHVVAEDPPLGTGGALGHLVDTAGLGRSGAPVLVLNGDLVTDMDLDALVDAHGARGAAATIMLVQVEDPSRFGIVAMDEDWRIRRFVEKPLPEEAPSDWANAGAYVLDPQVFSRVPRGGASSLERTVFPGVAEEDVMHGQPHRGLWIDCGTPQSYLQAHRVLMEQSRLQQSGGKKEGLPGQGEGNVFGERVQVAPDARVERSLLQDDVVVDPGAYVADSVIGARAVVGAGARLVGSIVQAGVRVQPGARIEGARVIEEAR